MSEFTSAQSYRDSLKALSEFAQSEAGRTLVTDRQRQILDVLNRAGSTAEAAEELGMTPTGIRTSLGRIRRALARKGYSPAHDMIHPTAEGFHTKGVSTYFNAQGVPTGQWVKTQKDKDDHITLLVDLLRETLVPEVQGNAPLIEPPEAEPNSELLAVYPFGDPHIGMFAWREETGDRNFDLKIAERNILRAVKRLVSLAPPSENGVIINLGDFFHADSFDNKTWRSGHALDVDGRYPKVLMTGIRIMRTAIIEALKKHQKVYVYNLLGNHDDHTSIVLSIALKSYFENDPRVYIETRPRQVHYFHFGRCLLGMHHGHLTKPQNLPLLMAADRTEEWGKTMFRRFYCGHVHHESVKEFPGCTVETFRTMAPKDAWHANMGYRAGNDMQVHVWSKTYGLINRHIVGIEALLGEDVLRQDKIFGVE